MSQPKEHSAETSFDEILAPVAHARRISVIAAVAVAALASYFELYARLGLPFDVIGVVATLVGGWPIWMEAWSAIREKKINMEITMALGVAAALAIGHFATASVIVAFTLFSMYLEDLTKSRGKRALEALLRARPESALVEGDDGWIKTAIEDVKVDDRVLVRPGETIPVDGEVIAGHSSVNEAAITGEPFPRDRKPGDRVFAGTLNGNGSLELRVARRGEDSTYARILALVKDAGERRGKTQRLADRVAQGIVYVVLAAATITYLLTRDVTSTISVILVAGACGVAAGTPLAILATTARSARRGVIVKGGEAVEALARADTIVFDKTGTLTVGEPQLRDVRIYNGTSRDEVLRLVKAVEEGSDHPIARAIQREPTRGRSRAYGVEYVAGRGVRGLVDDRPVIVGNLEFLEEQGAKVLGGARAEAEVAQQQGRTVVFAAVDRELVASLHLADTLRSDASDAIRRLAGAGMRIIMLTGDRRGTAEETARALGIKEVHAELLPEDKIRIVRELRESGRNVCFVGDGINDAPALMAADVGVAVGSGSDAALESADVVLMRDDLHELVRVIESSRKSQRVILFNFGGTLAVDLIGVGLAAFGLLGPLLAAFIHVGSELVFIANSARLFARAEDVTTNAK